MSARTKARKRSLDVLYEAEVRGEPVGDVLQRRLQRNHPPIPEYAVTLVEGVQAHWQRIDELLDTYSVGWSLERMPTVDRNILRLGVYELLWAEDVPDGVVLSEAVGIARELSTEESPSFINGLLGRLMELKPTLPA